jgi:hypothetical protein
LWRVKVGSCIPHWSKILFIGHCGNGKEREKKEKKKKKKELGLVFYRCRAMHVASGTPDLDPGADQGFMLYCTVPCRAV